MCTKFDPNCIYKSNQHIVAGDLEITSNVKLKRLVSKSPKQRKTANISWKEPKNKLSIVSNEHMKQLFSNKGIKNFCEWKNKKTAAIDNNISTQKTKIIKPVLNNCHFCQLMKLFIFLFFTPKCLIISIFTEFNN